MSETTTRPTGRSGTCPRRRGTVTEYDFAAPARLSREHARLLEVANDTFARQWTTQLGTRLRCAVAITFTGVTQSTYDAYVESIPAHPAMVLFQLGLDEPATGVLQLTTGTALAHLDHALGGPGGRDGEQPSRLLTEIETSLTLGMCTRVLGTLGYAFAALGSPAATVDGLQQDAQLLGAGRATDVVAVAEFAVQVGDHTDTATLMLPLAPLLARLSALTPQEVRTPQEVERAALAARTLHTTLPEVPVEVARQHDRPPAPARAAADPRGRRRAPPAAPRRPPAAGRRRRRAGGARRHDHPRPPPRLPDRRPPGGPPMTATTTPHGAGTPGRRRAGDRRPGRGAAGPGPAPARRRPRRRRPPAATAVAHVATFTGSRSGEVVVALDGALVEALTAGAPGLEVADVVRPALEAAAASLGPSVLSTVRPLSWTTSRRARSSPCSATARRWRGSVSPSAPRAPLRSAPGHGVRRRRRLRPRRRSVVSVSTCSATSR